MELRKNSSVERHLNALSRRGWLEVMPNVERGLVPLREGVPLYDEQQLQRVHMVQRQHGARPPEPTWLDCPALWTHFRETPDLCLRMGDGAVEGSAVIVALAREARRRGQCNRRRRRSAGRPDRRDHCRRARSRARQERSPAAMGERRRRRNPDHTDGGRVRRSGDRWLRDRPGTPGRRMKNQRVRASHDSTDRGGAKERT